MEILAILLVMGMAFLTLSLRSFIPYDETRYVAVAWEMWQSHHWFIPTINGELFADKPPLLFWLVDFGWQLFGVCAWWPRSIPFIFSLLNMFLARYIARQLWPDRRALRGIIPLMLLAVPVWFIYSTPFMFDMVQTCLILIAVAGLLGYRHGNLTGFLVFGAACGLGLLLKGPVILVYVLPLALTIPLWHEHYSPGHGAFLAKGLVTGLLLSLVIFSAWILPVINILGLEEVHALFLQQTSDRMLHHTSHARPFWWYFPFLPLLFFPWICKISFWRVIRHPANHWQSSPWRFLFFWIMPAFFFFIIIKAKQLHYLLPLLPPLVIGIAALFTESDEPVSEHDNYPAGLVLIFTGAGLFAYLQFIHHQHNLWLDMLSPILPFMVALIGSLLLLNRSRDVVRSINILALGTFIILGTSYVAILIAPRPFTNIDTISRVLASLQTRNIPVANFGTHTEQFEFLGRLPHTLEKLKSSQVYNWAQQHPDGYIITLVNDKDLSRMHPIYQQAYRFRQYLILLSCREYLRVKHDL